MMEKIPKVGHRVGLRPRRPEGPEARNTLVMEDPLGHNFPVITSQSQPLVASQRLGLGRYVQEVVLHAKGVPSGVPSRHFLGFPSSTAFWIQLISLFIGWIQQWT